MDGGTGLRTRALTLASDLHAGCLGQTFVIVRFVIRSADWGKDGGTGFRFARTLSFASEFHSSMTKRTQTSVRLSILPANRPTKSRTSSGATRAFASARDADSRAFCHACTAVCFPVIATDRTSTFRTLAFPAWTFAFARNINFVAFSQTRAVVGFPVVAAHRVIFLAARAWLLTRAFFAACKFGSLESKLAYAVIRFSIFATDRSACFRAPVSCTRAFTHAAETYSSLRGTCRFRIRDAVFATNGRRRSGKSTFGILCSSSRLNANQNSRLLPYSPLARKNPAVRQTKSFKMAVHVMFAVSQSEYSASEI